MTKVFVGGSRRITRINKSIRDYADDIIKKGHTVLIGDANGADKSMQRYFADKHYPNVIIFCAGNVYRNNLGNWEVRFIESSRAHRDFAYYAAKDLEMCREADYGFMLWDGKSKGTLSNILNLLESAKKVLVYFSPKRLLVNLHSIRDLTHLIQKCDRESLAYFDRTLRINQRLTANQGQLSLV